MEKVNGINVQKKCVTGESSDKEALSERVIATYGHLFIKGDEPKLSIWLKDENKKSFLKLTSDEMSKVP